MPIIKHISIHSTPLSNIEYILNGDSYTVITQVNETLRDIVNNAKNETELPLIDENKLHSILFAAGISSEKLDSLHAVFKEKVGEMACAEKTKIQDGYVLGKGVIDRLNGLIKTSSLSDCIWEFEEKWEGIIAETKMKNPRSYLKSTLFNWLLDYKLEDFCYAF